MMQHAISNPRRPLSLADLRAMRLSHSQMVRMRLARQSDPNDRVKASRSAVQMGWLSVCLVRDAPGASLSPPPG